jgi:ribosomal protein L37AE/L43A
MTDYEKVIKIHQKSLIPTDIIKSAGNLQSYLSENVIENRKDELTRLRYMKASRTRKFNLEQKARQIKVTPSTDSESIKQQQTKVWRCKKATKSESVSEAEPKEGSLVVSTIKGIVTICDNCTHKWIHHSNNLGKQYYAQCPGIVIEIFSNFKLESNKESNREKYTHKNFKRN